MRTFKLRSISNVYRKFQLCEMFPNILLCCLMLTGAVLTRRVKRVIGGMEVQCGTQMRICSLRNSTNTQHLCGATIISSSLAVTAAHCVHYAPTEYFLSLDNYCINDHQPPPTAEVLEIITHPSYHKYTRAHDIALLRIKLALENTTWLQENLLPKSSFGLSGECTIYGYGYKDRDSTDISEKLLAAKLKIISLDECTQLLGPYVAPAPDSGILCAIGNGADSCQGDSGGPLICGDFLEGICSHGLGCGVPGLPGFYTSIGANLRWVHEVIDRS